MNEETITACSFCSKKREEVLLLIAGPEPGLAICDECIHLCLHVLLEGGDSPVPAYAGLHDLDALLKRYRATKKPDVPSVAQRSSGLDLTCSFCGRHQREVSKLVAGPRHYICDQCTATAAEVLLAHPRK